MNNDPDVKRCLLYLRSQGQFAGLQWTKAGGWVSLGRLNGFDAEMLLKGL